MTDETDGQAMEDAAKGVSRRNFIKGVISSGVAVSSANYLFRATSVFAQTSGDPGDRLLTLNVNGQQRRVDVMKQETLAWTLRYKLGLTGTKLGCDRAECGACTVLIDDVPHYSCSVLTHTVRGKKVLSIEMCIRDSRFPFPHLEFFLPTPWLFFSLLACSPSM